jgi:hypothetical protein
VARIKLTYPKMHGSRDAPLKRCVAFEKYDGTNLHWLWLRELGWAAFGTRRDQFSLDVCGIAEFRVDHPEMEEAPDVFINGLAEPLAQVFQRNDRYDSAEVKVFTEFLGPNSFAGKHRREDLKRLILFDAETDRGFIEPDDFISDFSGLPIARVVYRGKLTGKFIHDLREGRFGVNEGVVCKGVESGKVWMAKVKTLAYMERLKQAFKDDWEKYWE